MWMHPVDNLQNTSYYSAQLEIDLEITTIILMRN